MEVERLEEDFPVQQEEFPEEQEARLFWHKAPWPVHLAAVFYLLPGISLYFLTIDLSMTGKILCSYVAPIVVGEAAAMTLIYSRRRWGKWLAVLLPLLFWIPTLYWYYRSVQVEATDYRIFSGFGEMALTFLFGLFAVLPLPGALILIFSRKAGLYYAGKQGNDSHEEAEKE